MVDTYRVFLIIIVDIKIDKSIPKIGPVLTKGFVACVL